jgi:hypothetical protein
LVNFYQTTRRYNPEDSHLSLILVPKREEIAGKLRKYIMVLIICRLL